MTTNNVLRVADHTITPGGRYKSDGPFSAEWFRNDILIPAFDQARAENKRVVVNMDGVYGYAASFLEEVFGGLARARTADTVLLHLEIICDDEPRLIDNVLEYVCDADPV